MSFPARGEYVKLGKGALFLGEYVAGVAPEGKDFMGNVNALTLSGDIATAELKSSTQASGALIDKRVLSAAYSITASCNEATMGNISKFVLGSRANKAQAAVTDVERTFTNVSPGKYYDLNGRQITSVQVFRQGNSSPLVETTDYTLDTEFGILGTVIGGAILEGDELVANFNTPVLTIRQVRLAAASSKTASLLFVADDANNDGKAAKDRLEVWRVSIIPDGDFGFIGDDYASFNLQMAILSDGTLHPNDPFGTLDRVGDTSNL